MVIGDHYYLHTNNAALQVRPASSTNVCLHLQRQNAQAKPMLKVNTVGGYYDGGDGLGTSNVFNHVVNEHGFLRLPLFKSRGDLYNLVGGEFTGTGADHSNPSYAGMMALFDMDNNPLDPAYRQVYYEGTKWRYAGSNQSTI